MNDTFARGTIAGLLGTLADAAVHWPAYYILGTTTTAHYIEQLMFPFTEPTTLTLALGFFTHLVAGALVGLVLLYLYSRWGYDYALLKGIGVGVAFWIVHVAVIPNVIFAPRPLVFRTGAEALVDLVAHLLYGIVASTYLVKKQLLSQR